MKRKTKIFGAILPLFGVGVLATIPLITTSCASDNQNQPSLTGAALVNDNILKTLKSNFQTSTTTTAQNIDTFFNKFVNDQAFLMDDFVANITSTVTINEVQETIKWNSDASSNPVINEKILKVEVTQSQLTNKVFHLEGLTSKIDGRKYLLVAKKVSLKDLNDDSSLVEKNNFVVFEGYRPTPQELVQFLDTLKLPTDYEEGVKYLVGEGTSGANSPFFTELSGNDGTSNKNDLKGQCFKIGELYKSYLKIGITNDQITEIKNKVSSNNFKDTYTAIYEINKYIDDGGTHGKISELIEYVGTSWTVDFPSLGVVVENNEALKKAEGFIKSALTFYIDYANNLKKLLS